MPSINITEALHKKLQDIVKNSSEYKSIDAFAEFVLQEITRKKLQNVVPSEAYSEEEEKKIKERLQNLGYLE